MKKLLLTAMFMLTLTAVYGQQKKTAFKLMASVSGLGAAFEYNPVSIVFVQANLTSTFTITRFGLQSKLALYRGENFRIKAGVEGAYFLGDLNVGGFSREFDSIEFMPLVAFEWKVLGLEIPLILERDFSGVFPMVAITLNVTNDEKK